MSTTPKKPKARRMWQSKQSDTVFPDKKCFLAPSSCFPVAVIDVSEVA